MEYRDKEKLQKGMVIVGNGIAGLSAAEAARKNNKSIPICMISEEAYLTYYRLKLCSYLSGDMEDNELIMRKAECIRKII